MSTARTERARQWWLKAIFFIPLVILIAERLGGTIGVMYDLSSYQNTWEKMDDFMIAPLKYVPIPNYSKVPLSNVTRSLHVSTCPDGLHPIMDTVRDTHEVPEGRRIPKIIHQTSKSRCMTPPMEELTKNWRKRFPDYEYYFHDDDAIDRLLQQDWPEFPHLATVSKCLVHGTARSDLWRYVVLWEYGGVYADLDSAPNLLNVSSFEHVDSLFVVEQYHLLSQYFMAVSPHHPVMFYAIHHALANILKEADTGKMDTPYTTGPHALHQGFQTFMKDVGVVVPAFARGVFAVKAQTYVGTNKRSVTAVGRAQNQNEYVEREKIRRPHKIKEYEKMKMTHFWQDRNVITGKSCLTVLMDQEQVRLQALASD